MCDEHRSESTKSRFLKFTTQIIFIATIIYAALIFYTIIYTKNSTPIYDASSQIETNYKCRSDGVWELAHKINSLLYLDCKPLNLNEMGDFLAGSFSFIALIWAALGFAWQATEFSLQRLEYIESNRILRGQSQQYLDKNTQERNWRKDLIAMEEVKFCREKKQEIVATAQHIYDRHNNLNQRRPQSISASVVVLENSLKMLDGPIDRSDKDIIKTIGDLEQLSATITYLVVALDSYDIKKRIPVSNGEISKYRFLSRSFLDREEKLNTSYQSEF